MAISLKNHKFSPPTPSYIEGVPRNFVPALVPKKKNYKDTPTESQKKSDETLFHLDTILAFYGWTNVVTKGSIALYVLCMLTCNNNN